MVRQFGIQGGIVSCKPACGCKPWFGANDDQQTYQSGYGVGGREHV